MTRIRPWHIPLGIGGTVALASLLAFSPARAQRIRCPTGDTVIAVDGSEDGEITCSGVADAKNFLRSVGFNTEARIEVRIVRELPDGREWA
jgi:multidrug efflux pump subunit AcrA (membrane-fusion protein)